MSILQRRRNLRRKRWKNIQKPALLRSHSRRSLLNRPAARKLQQATANMRAEAAVNRSSASSGEKFHVLVKLRIEKDGRVSNFEIVKPSGNATVDESVAAVAKHVTQVDPLPAGLGSGDRYDVKINFELNSEQ